MTLHPTKTRLALLRAVQARQVFAVARERELGFESYLADADFGDLKVTARADEARAAGWIERGSAMSSSFFSRRWYHLTDAGRAVLDEASPS